MPRVSSVASPEVADRLAGSRFICRSEAGSCASWVQPVGTLDITTSTQLGQALSEAWREALLVVLDLREVTSIDSSGVQVIRDADVEARRQGRRMLVARGPEHVDDMFTLAARADLLIFNLDPDEPAAERLEW